MAKRILVGFVVFMASTLVAVAHQGSEHKASDQFLTFRKGQTVYIAAFRQFHHEHRATEPTVKVIQELDVERRVRKEFEGLGFFKVVDKLSDAEFVFLVYVDSSTAEGLTLPPEKYREAKEKFDLDMLREAAYGRYMVGPFRVPTLGKISDRLSKSFHKDVMKSDKTTSR